MKSVWDRIDEPGCTKTSGHADLSEDVAIGEHRSTRSKREAALPCDRVVPGAPIAIGVKPDAPLISIIGKTG